MPSLIDYLGLIITPSGTPAMGDMIVRGQSGGWTTVQATNAKPNALLTYDLNTALPLYKGGVVTALPAASVAFQGVVMTLAGGSGVADTAYVCLKAASGTYSWKQVVTG